MNEPLAALADLRSAGAHQLDPMRFHYLDALASRAQTAAPAVQAVLAATLGAALADYQHRFAHAQQTRHNPENHPAAQATESNRERRQRLGAQQRPNASAAESPLAELTRYIERVRQLPADDPLEHGAQPHQHTQPELNSVRRFRETWSRISAEDQVDLAVERGPENAGPLNSHLLVLRSLALMRELSPDYLRRFLTHADTLLWIEQASARLKPAAAKPKPKPARAVRAKKPG
ncbi:DUF2894 domain-containing protein [Hydrogenophaga sp.]|uniref:DUF2894 domain-containing protein n=1 Tax=Hydrogenophaga sp. TaxID=1904254 RepID=UPI003F6D4E5C